jgi:hypothetical protein
MKHPKLRVASAVDLHSSVIDELFSMLQNVTALLPITPVDAEICGSYANGCARLHSDLDIALPCKDWNEQMLLRRAMFGGNVKLASSIRAILFAFEEKNGVKIDLNPIIPDNKENTTYATYSLTERVLYNKPADLVNSWLKLSPYTQRYVLTPYELNEAAVNSKHEVRALVAPAKFSDDEWIAEVSEWRAIYGDKFLEYKSVLRADGTAELSE